MTRPPTATRADTVTDTGPTGDDTPEIPAEPRRRLSAERQILLISAIALFIELTWIRFVGSEIRIFAYFSNLLLLVCFLGLGIGCMRADRPVRLRWPYLCSLAITLALVPDEALGRFALRRLTGYLGADADFHIWAAGGSGEGLMAVARFGVGLLMLLAIVAAIIAVMMPLGQILGRLLARAPDPIRAYSADITGSLLGVLAFTAASFFNLPPPAWFALGLGALLYFLPRRRAVIAAAVVSIALTAWLSQQRRAGEDEVVWSPYQRLSRLTTFKEDARGEQVETGFYVRTNHADYMRVGNYAPEFVERYPEFFAPPELRPYDNYSLPYRFHPSPKNVLIVGAGAGNDVAGALRNGATHIDAVEIDPQIVEFGRQFHPEGPYGPEYEGRVHIHVEDARSFFKKAQRRYDLIIFGTLDSHTQSSSRCNVRLDNFVYTAESFAEARDLLEPDGVMVLLFAVNEEFIGVRMRRALEQLFGYPPYCLSQRSKIVYWVYYFVVGNQDTIEARLEADPRLRTLYEQNRVEWNGDTKVVTDDWPYLFLVRPTIPRVYLAVFGLILALSAVLLRGEIGRGKLRPWSSAVFFFLGAGFMLLEVHGITRAALAFGATWLNNAIVISGILIAILLANRLVRRTRLSSVPVAFAAVFALLAINYLVPTSLFNDFDLGPRLILVAALICSPVVAAGVIFASVFRDTEDRSHAFAANLLGAMFGGMSESLSFLIGIDGLSLVAIGFYALALIAYRRSRRPA